MQQKVLCLVIFLCLSTSWAIGQENTKFKITGNLGFTTEFYQFDATDSTLLPRRPDFNYRLFFNPTFRFGKNIAIPVSLVATKRFKQAYLPLPTYDNPLRNLTNPNNSIGISPTFGWATFHLGSHTANFSELSTGNLPIFGGGIDLKPGLWRFAYSYGVVNWALQPDTTINLAGDFERRFQAVKIGWGQDNTHFYINTTKISDQEKSMEGLNRKASEGALFTLQIGFEFSDHISANAEIGASAFTKDKDATGIKDKRVEFVPDDLLIVNESTRLDYAQVFSFKIHYPTWGLTFKRKKLGAGYETLGYRFVETDVLDYTVSPRLQLFNNKFILNATGGIREDNLSKTKVATTKRIIASGNVMALFSDEFSLSGTYSNYGSRNNLDNDTLRLEFVSQNITISPVYRITDKKASHTISATFALSDFEDRNLFNGEVANNQTQTVSGSYALSLGAFSFTTAGTYMENKRSTGLLDVTTLTVRPGYALFKRKLNTSIGFVYALIGQEGFTDSKRVIIRPKIRWRLTPKLTMNIRGSLHTYRYGTIRNNAMYDESFLQTGITQQF